MTIVVLTRYSDSPSENLYTGEDWKDAMKALCESYCTEFTIQQWSDRNLIEEWKK